MDLQLRLYRLHKKIQYILFKYSHTITIKLIDERKKKYEKILMTLSSTDNCRILVLL